MALFQCHYRSEVLELNTNVNVICPQDLKKDEKIKVLYLLHGYKGDHTDWIRQTSIERYIEDYRVAVVMPSVHNSYYTDMTYGSPYYTFISEELPLLISNTFSISLNREDTYICGLSMGGYGALKIALSNPDKFHKVASLSGALDIASSIEMSKENNRRRYLDAVFGSEPIKGSNNDLKYLVKEAKQQSQAMPHIYIACGTEDFLYEGNQQFVHFLDQESIKYTYQESKGEHHWQFWDEYIQKVLQWMF